MTADPDQLTVGVDDWRAFCGGVRPGVEREMAIGIDADVGRRGRSAHDCDDVAWLASGPIPYDVVIAAASADSTARPSSRSTINTVASCGLPSASVSVIDVRPSTARAVVTTNESPTPTATGEASSCEVWVPSVVGVPWRRLCWSSAPTPECSSTRCGT